MADMPILVIAVHSAISLNIFLVFTVDGYVHTYDSELGRFIDVNRIPQDKINVAADMTIQNLGDILCSQENRIHIHQHGVAPLSVLWRDYVQAVGSDQALLDLTKIWTDHVNETHPLICPTCGMNPEEGCGMCRAKMKYQRLDEEDSELTETEIEVLKAFNRGVQNANISLAKRYRELVGDEQMDKELSEIGMGSGFGSDELKEQLDEDNPENSRCPLSPNCMTCDHHLEPSCWDRLGISSNSGDDK